MDAQEALKDELQKMKSDETKYGYESTNMFKFDDVDQDKIMEGLTGDEGQKLAENMIDSMSSLQTKEDLQLSKKKKKAKGRKHRKKRGRYHYGRN